MLKNFIFIILFLCLVVYVSLSLGLHTKSINIESNITKPMLEFQNIEVFDIKDGVYIQKLSAKKYQKYQKYDIAKDVKVLKYDKQIYELSANDIKNSKNIVSFGDNIILKIKNSFVLYGSNIIFNKNKNIMSSQDDFTLKNSNNYINGKSFVYNINSNNFKAHKIKARYKLKD